MLNNSEKFHGRAGGGGDELETRDSAGGFDSLPPERQLDILKAFIDALKKNNLTAGAEGAVVDTTNESGKNNEVLSLDNVQHYELLANRESVEAPKVFARLVADVKKIMGIEEVQRKSAVVDLPSEIPVVVVSELNGDRAALVGLLQKHAHVEGVNETENFSGDQFRDKTYFDLLREGKINLVFTGNYTHQIGAIARERQQKANERMASGEDGGLMLDNDFQNGVMSDALNCLQMVLSLKKQFPKNITLLANSYELLLDRHVRGMDMGDRGVNENIAYVDWLKSYFGPNQKSIDKNISQMTFEKMRFPVLATVRDAGVIISPSVPSRFYGSGGKKRVSGSAKIIEALRRAEPAAVAAMCTNEKVDLTEIGRFASALGIKNPIIWVTAGGKYTLGEGEEDVTAEDVAVIEESDDMESSLVRFNNRESVLGVYSIGLDRQTRDVSGELATVVSPNSPKTQVAREKLFERHV